MRRGIFSYKKTTTVAVNKPPIAISGVNQSIQGTTVANLVGSESYDIDGTIASYLWTQVTSFNGVVITTPNAADTSISGLTLTNTNYVFRLTVTDNSGATNSSDITISTAAVAPSSGLVISNSGVTGGSGTLDLSGGTPYDKVYLSFLLINSNVGDSADFSGANVGVLDWLHTIRSGAIQLASDGTATKNFSSTGDNFTCEVNMTSTLLGGALPNVTSTLITFPSNPI